MNKTFSNVNPAAKKISFILIFALVIAIGVLWYLGYQKGSEANNNILQIASSTKSVLDLKALEAGQKNIEEIISAKLVASDTSSLLLTEPAKVKPYTYADLIVSNLNSSSSLRAYGLKIATALKPFNTIRENPVVTTVTALETKDSFRARLLSSQAASFKQIISTLLKTAVPKNAAEIHLQLINDLNQLATRYTEMSLILDNPYLALKSTQLYNAQILNFYQTVDRINAFFKNNGIVFQTSESNVIYAN